MVEPVEQAVHRGKGDFMDEKKGKRREIFLLSDASYMKAHIE